MCGTLSSLVQVTVAPASTSMVAGSNVRSMIETAAGPVAVAIGGVPRAATRPVPRTRPGRRLDRGTRVGGRSVADDGDRALHLRMDGTEVGVGTRSVEGVLEGGAGGQDPAVEGAVGRGHGVVVVTVDVLPRHGGADGDLEGRRLVGLVDERDGGLQRRRTAGRLLVDDDDGAEVGGVLVVALVEVGILAGDDEGDAEPLAGLEVARVELHGSLARAHAVALTVLVAPGDDRAGRHLQPLGRERVRDDDLLAVLTECDGRGGEAGERGQGRGAEETSSGRVHRRIRPQPSCVVRHPPISPTSAASMASPRGKVPDARPGPVGEVTRGLCGVRLHTPAASGRGLVSLRRLPRLPQALHVRPPVLGAHRAQAVLAAGLLRELADRCLVGLDAEAGAEPVQRRSSVVVFFVVIVGLLR